MIVITGHSNRQQAGRRARVQDNRIDNRQTRTGTRQDNRTTGYRIQDTHAKTGPRPSKWVINTQCVKVVIEFHFQ